MIVNIHQPRIVIITTLFLLTSALSIHAQKPKTKKNATIQGVYVGNDASSVKAFEAWLGKPVQAVLGYTSGGEKGDWNTPDPGWQIEMKEFLGGSGRQILWSIPMAPDDGGVKAYQEISEGKHNALYEGWAKKILKSRITDNDPIYVRTTWELGGEWFPWTQAAKDNPEAYRKAFGQFATSFHKISNRFKMVWDFTSDRGPVEQWYPGDDAVDVISQDIYWIQKYSGNTAQGAFQWAKDRSRGLDWMANFANIHGKPMAISEWGAPGEDDSKLDGAKFIELISNWINTHNVVYATYWNAPKESSYDGKLSDDKPSKAASALKQLYLTGKSAGEKKL